MREAFERIYEKNLWGGGSGAGSSPENTEGYRAFLKSFLKENSIQSVVDLGCGDWQFSRYIDWSEISYTGIDVAESLVLENKRKYGSENIDFISLDITKSVLPSADLILIKDVFQHWGNSEILSFIPKIKAYKYALITNCITPSAKGQFINQDIENGSFRPLDLRLPPFSLNCKLVYSFSKKPERFIENFFDAKKWRKKVYLLTSD